MTVNLIYLRYTDLVEPFGIDESWLDITGSMHLFGEKDYKTAEKIALASLVISVIQWLVTLLLNLKK